MISPRRREPSPCPPSHQAGARSWRSGCEIREARETKKARTWRCEFSDSEIFWNAFSMNSKPESISEQFCRASMGAEGERLQEDAARKKNWKRWGSYLSERQWGTVREDYSATGECWDYFPHDHARSRTYRWGEDGLLGITDREGRLCFAVALWNGRDPILKERLFGLSGPEGKHGEDVKEEYFYLDATPTHSYA